MLKKALQRFNSQLGTIRSGALTYQTSLALLPILALISAIAGRFGYIELFIEWLEYQDQRLDLDLPFQQLQPILDRVSE
jgi:uncharacterized BrkB/YihY/UPF0761 family membrane protein